MNVVYISAASAGQMHPATNVDRAVRAGGAKAGTDVASPGCSKVKQTIAQCHAQRNGHQIDSHLMAFQGGPVHRGCKRVAGAAFATLEQCKQR